jgi:hypothetical protein
MEGRAAPRPSNDLYLSHWNAVYLYFSAEAEYRP